MTDLEVLEQARALIAPENSWCQGRLNYETLVPDGSIFPWRKVMVTQRCAWGALRAAMGVEGGNHPIEYAGATVRLAAAISPSMMGYAMTGYYGLRHTHYELITTYNDQHTHDQVLEMFDRAIALAKGAEEEKKLKVAQYVTAADRDLAVAGD